MPLWVFLIIVTCKHVLETYFEIWESNWGILSERGSKPVKFLQTCEGSLKRPGKRTFIVFFWVQFAWANCERTSERRFLVVTGTRSLKRTCRRLSELVNDQSATRKRTRRVAIVTCSLKRTRGSLKRTASVPTTLIFRSGLWGPNPSFLKWCFKHVKPLLIP